MKKTFLLLALFFVQIFNIADAQDINLNPACLGTLCYVDVDLQNDPTERGYAKYPISAPPEEIGYINMWYSPTRVNCMGPGRPFIDLLDSNNPILNIYIQELDLVADETIHAYIEVPVNKTVPNLGISGSEQVQCYYYIILVLKK